MANMDLEFNRGSTDYNDGSVENELLDIVRFQHGDFDRVIAKDRRWPILYHLSHLRENIVNWYPFSPDAEVLEVGAGCGAITGQLCASAGHVTAVELTQRRAEINYYRHQDMKNLDIFVGDIFDIHFEKKFDYITLIGVLEYAGLMFHGEKPHQHLLETLKKMLKPEGHILIAIENRLGLKYFAGAREDHTGGFFDGINEYPAGGPAQTFSKQELKTVLRESGFDSPDFYYPLPDYKFPKMIYTDESAEQFDANLNFDALDRERFALFDEKKMAATLAREGQIGTFSNSFFVDTKPLAEKVVMARISTERKPAFRVVTLVRQSNEKRYVEKKAVGKQSISHIERMAQLDGNFTTYGFQTIGCEITERGTIRYPFLDGDSLLSLLSKALDEKNMSLFYKLLDQYHRDLFTGTRTMKDIYGDAFVQVFGTAQEQYDFHCSDRSNADINFDNIILSGMDNAVLFDYEWCFPFPIPVEFVFWRAVRNAKFPADIMREIFEKYGLDASANAIFEKWEQSFLFQYVGSFDIALFSQPSHSLNLEAINESLHQTKFRCSFYTDDGSGFTEKGHICSSYMPYGEEQSFTMTLTPQEQLSGLRFDPCDEAFTGCSIREITSEAGVLSWSVCNSAFSDHQIDWFLTDDPQYLLHWKNDPPHKVTIKFTVYRLPPAEMANHLRLLHEKEQAAMDQVQKTKLELESERMKYHKIITSVSWRWTEPFRLLHRRLPKK